MIPKFSLIFLEEKVQLLEELKEFLESVSLTEKLKAEAEEANAQQEVLAKAPLPIFIGSVMGYIDNHKKRYWSPT